MKKEDKYSALKLKSPNNGRNSGIDKKYIEQILILVNLNKPDIIDVVYTFLEDKLPNPFHSNYKFKDGITVAEIASYIGIYLRGNNKLDREGRDYWLKPLIDIAVVEKVTFDKKTDKFLPGHLIAKSSNSAYALNEEFLQLLINKNTSELIKFLTKSKIGERLAAQAQVIEESSISHGPSDHALLIKLASTYYKDHFLPKFEIIYIDDSDGDRISESEKTLLERLKIKITLSDSFPDIILISEKRELWFIEAVTSDGEVDNSKLQSLKEFCIKNNATFAGATTAYLNWKDAAKRQDQFKNLSPDTYLWIASDPKKHLLII